MNSDFEITIYNEFSLIKLLSLVKSNQELVLQDFKTADQAHTMIRTGKLFVCFAFKSAPVNSLPFKLIGFVKSMKPIWMFAMSWCHKVSVSHVVQL